MQRFIAGDAHAFRKLFDKHKKRVINYCYRFCGSHSVAEDLAQETFLRVYKAAPRYKPTAKFNTWLFKIATNLCLNELRKPLYRSKIESLESFERNENGALKEGLYNGQLPRTDTALESHETQRYLRKAIMELPEKQRAALLLRIDEEFSYKEIGEQIHRSENHVKILIHRARKQLKKTLKIY